MQHGREEKFQSFSAQVDFVAVGDGNCIVGYAIEAIKHFQSLGVPDNLHVRKFFFQRENSSGMVGFHMVDYQIVNFPVGTNCFYFAQLLKGMRNLNSVDQRGFACSFHQI